MQIRAWTSQDADKGLNLRAVRLGQVEERDLD